MADLPGDMIGGALLLLFAYGVVGLICSVPASLGLPHAPGWVHALRNLLGELALLTILVGAILMSWSDEVRFHRGLLVAVIVLSALFLLVGRLSRGGRLR